MEEEEGGGAQQGREEEGCEKNRKEEGEGRVREEEGEGKGKYVKRASTPIMMDVWEGALWEYCIHRRPNRRGN